MSRKDIIGGFQRLREIGAGAQARVWRAKCVEDVHGIVPRGTVVALKIRNVPAGESDEQFGRLKKRIDELTAMRHPNVVRYLGCFRERSAEHDFHVVVQECLEGETLKERLSKLRLGLDVDEGLRIVRAASEGLEYTAGLKIYHRDIKPGNIFLCEDGTVKLIDFGVAKQDGETVDGSSNLRGTFNYMAPDFMLPTFTGDQQSDLFSLGVVFHEVISGKLPYLDASAVDWQGWMSRWRQWTENAAKADSPIFVHAMTMRLLVGAYETLEKALEPSRSRRYADFAAFRRDLDKIGFCDQKHDGRTYRRLQFVGKGGFGEVFKARWLEQNVDVAVKQLLNADYARRFRVEARVMQELRDPCFVEFIDFFETADHAFLVMRYLEGMPGGSLRDAINRAGANGIPKNLVLPAFERYARGLSLMHRRKIVHRDIKPSNLYYPQGRPDLVAIMDFGIVRVEDSSFTSGMVPCTLDYAPPEVAVTENRGGPGMDIYALGLCMYEALTGRQGYSRLPTGTAGLMTFFERCKAMLKPDFSDPRVTEDAGLLALLRKMTAPELSDRYQDADEVAVDIRKLFYRRTADDDCPPTQVFDPATDRLKPIDEKRLMAWYGEWVKVHPERAEEPAVPVPASVRPQKWKGLLLTGLVAACVSAGGVFVAFRAGFLQPPPPPPPAPPPPQEETVDLPPPRNAEVVELKRQLFERDFAAAVADEPVESRRKRIAAAADMLTRARADGLYDDASRWTAFEKRLEAASAAAVGKVRNACGCELEVDGQVLAVGEVRLVRFADGGRSNRWMRIFGHDARKFPDGLDGRIVEVKRGDFAVSSVDVALPALEDDVQCLFEGRPAERTLSLKPGNYQCEYRRKGYVRQQVAFTVELGRNRTLPPPGEWKVVPPPPPKPVPKVQPATPKVQPTTPKVQPVTPKVQPATPKVQPATPKVQPATPKVQPTTPKVQPKATLQAEVIPQTKPKPKPQSETKPRPVQQPEPPVSPEIRKLLSDARFYFDDGDYELTVKSFYEAFVKGYRLDANDKNVFESAYRRRRDYLKSRIDRLEKQEFRKSQNLRDIEEYREKLRQLGEWYRAVKRI